MQFIGKEKPVTIVGIIVLIILVLLAIYLSQWRRGEALLSSGQNAKRSAKRRMRRVQTNES